MAISRFPKLQRANRKPEQHVVPVIGGWNPDATETSIPLTDFVEMKNFRKMRPEECETRSGYKQFKYAGDFTPLAKAEFRLGETFVDVTFYTDSVNLTALIINPVTTPVGDVRIFLGQYGANPTVCATQFTTYLIVSITSTLDSPNDVGLFALSPPYDPLTKQPDFTGTWNKIAIGKDVCPTPTAVNFEDEVKGDLFVYNSQTDAAQELTFINDPTTGKPQTIPLALSCPYWRSGTTKVEYMKERLFVQTGNESSSTSTIDKHLDTHPESRAWGYRFTFVRSVTDAKGQTQTFVSEPSADMWVRDNIYCPPVLGLRDLDSDGKIRFTDIIYGVRFYNQHYHPAGDVLSIDFWRDKPPLDPATNARSPVYDVDGDGNHEFRVGDLAGAKAGTAAAGFPTNADYFTLRNLFRNATLPNFNKDPYFYTALWLGWFASQDFKLPGQITPYQVAVPVSKLKNAPCTIFNWSDFPGISSDPNVTEIRIYRTAYGEPNDADNALLSPSFEAHRFGYVGSITPSGSFTDDIADSNIDFGTSPTRYEGYLNGQLAGQVIRVYEDHIVLGNTISKHWKLQPTELLQAFWYPFFAGPIFFNDFAVSNLAADNLPLNQLWYSYTDLAGNESDATPITVECPTSAPSTGNVMLVFPRGYSVEVGSINLYRSVYDFPGIPGRSYFKVATIPVSSTFYNMDKRLSVTQLIGTPPDVGTDGSLLLKVTQTSHDPGYIIWSEANQMFFWPQENIENEHDQNPITHLNTVIGPLYTLSDKGVNMTRLDGYREPVSSEVGCIARNAAIKVDKVVYFLSASGLYFVEGSGVVAFPVNVQTEVLKYLREQIDGIPPLTNARRAALGWLGQRNELWLSFPSSGDLGGSMPARTFIYKKLLVETQDGQTITVWKNYEFDIAVGNPVGPIIYLAHADHKLFCAFHQSQPTLIDPDHLIIQDNDTDDIWTGKAYLQYQNPMGQAHLDKKLQGLEWIAEGRGDIGFCTGVTRTDGGRQDLHGTIKQQARIRNAKVLDAGYTQFFKVPINGPEIETSGRPPAIRFITEPNIKGEHTVKFKSLGMQFTYEHNHR